jgi:predicted nucleic acid-binding protein
MGLNDLLNQYKRIAIDTNVFIAVFAQEPLGEKVIPIINATANQGTHQLITSVLAFSECAVKPYRDKNWSALDWVKLMFQMPNLTVYSMDDIVAEEAARIRAVYNFKMPDAIIIATTIVYKAEILLTNDHRLTIIREIPVLTLDDL